MKLSELFNEVKYGKEVFESSKSTDEIIECYDTDYKKFFVSKRIGKLSENISQDSSTKEIVSKFIDLFEEIENKEVSSSKVYPVFYKMRLSNLTENYNKLIKKFDNVKYTKEIDRTKFGKMLGTIQYGIEYVAESASSKYTIAKTPILLEELSETESKLIESIIE